MSGEPFRKQVWEGDVNVTPTSPGYCDFFDEFKCHAYMGGVLVRGEYRDDWTTCCGVDCPGADEAWEAAEAEVERLRGELARRDEQITAVRALEPVRITRQVLGLEPTKILMVRLEDIERALGGKP